MSEAERYQARYERRKAKREEKVRARSAAIGTFDEIFSFDHIVECAEECCKGVKWKNSTERFETGLLSECLNIYNRVRKKAIKLKGLDIFTLREGGKCREIGAPYIEDRVICKVIVRYILVPLYTPHLINENGACMKGKGFTFTLNCLKRHLLQHYKKYGREGYIILWDFEHYFPSALHEVLREHHESFIKDETVRTFVDNVIDYYDSYKGLNLGMETSQIEMVCYPYKFDAYIKCQLHISTYGHYMDDGYILTAGTKEEAQELLNKVIEKASELGLTINKTKTKIIPLTKKFTFCHAKFILTDTGKVLIRCNPKSVTRARRRVISFGKKRGTMLGEDIRNALMPSRAYIKRYNNYASLTSFDRLVRKTFGYPLSNKDAWRKDDEEKLLAKGEITQEYMEFLHSDWKHVLRTPLPKPDDSEDDPEDE